MDSICESCKLNFPRFHMCQAHVWISESAPLSPDWLPNCAPKGEIRSRNIRHKRKKKEDKCDALLPDWRTKPQKLSSSTAGPVDLPGEIRRQPTGGMAMAMPMEAEWINYFMRICVSLSGTLHFPCILFPTSLVPCTPHPPIPPSKVFLPFRKTHTWRY